MNEIHFTSAAELARRIRLRELSPVELLETVIDRIEERNPHVNAVVYKGYDDARAAARKAEQAVTTREELGAFHGVPTLMKDLFDFKPGWISTMGGVRALAGYIPDFACGWVERMEHAGAIIVGKTNTPVLGLRGVTDNPLFGPARNPFDLTRNPGGSSGGSAAAVADGMVPFAEGTDAGGSIRIPSALSGVYGFKASLGRTPAAIRPNAFGGISPFVHEGVIARTVLDVAVGTGILSGIDPRDPFSHGEPADFTAHLNRGVRRMRIAYSPDFGTYPVAPDVAAVVAASVKQFERAGAVVEQIDIDLGMHQSEMLDMFMRLIAVQNMETIDNLAAQGVDLRGEHAADLPRAVHESAALGNRLTARDISRDQRLRTGVYDAIQTVFDTYDLLITPTVAVTAPVNDTNGETEGPSEVNGEAVDPLLGWCLTYPINMTGNPAASVPAGLTAQGLPVGMQIIGRRGQDGDVFAASAAFEELQPWIHTYPGHIADPTLPS
ncbi:amidase [Rhizohabitans arisaemae]|uniref:amidase n=1 Tax=Rhizohabitans arisaemae TaxID=2720610 RepID=UPI0024B1E6F8|nr:amidase [Rhizohabitans arisaemae]